MRAKFVLCILAVFAASIGEAQNITVGVPSFDPNLNVLTSDHPAAAFIRSAAVQTLTKPEGARGRLAVSESMSVSPDGKMLSFRPHANARFSSGRRVLASDIIFSLNRCSAAKTLEGVLSVSEQKQIFRGKTTAVIEVALLNPITASTQLVPPSLSKCPIIEERTSLLFGQDLGHGGNVLASGNYKITAFSLGKEYTLTKINDHLRESPASFTIRGLEDSSHALTALRAGTLDAMFTNAGAEIEKAKIDPTLSVSECLRYTVIRRHDLEFPCDPSLSPQAIKYSAAS